MSDRANAPARKPEARIETRFSQMQKAGISQSISSPVEQILFGAGRYAPDTWEGKHLLAHELTHILQQEGVDRTRISESSGFGAIRERPPQNALLPWNKLQHGVDKPGAGRLHLPLSWIRGKPAIYRPRPGGDQPDQLRRLNRKLRRKLSAAVLREGDRYCAKGWLPWPELHCRVARIRQGGGHRPLVLFSDGMIVTNFSVLHRVTRSLSRTFAMHWGKRPLKSTSWHDDCLKIRVLRLHLPRPRNKFG